jgi:hypothetical protein
MRGRVVDEARASFDLARWRQDLSAAPPGWQRLTAGVTDMRAEVERTLRERAPHVLGVSVAGHADGVGFTSEREARAGERQMPVEMAVQLGTVRSYMEGLEFLELREPVLAGPAVPVR